MNAHEKAVEAMAIAWRTPRIWGRLTAGARESDLRVCKLLRVGLSNPALRMTTDAILELLRGDK